MLIHFSFIIIWLISLCKYTKKASNLNGHSNKRDHLLLIIPEDRYHQQPSIHFYHPLI